MSKVNAIYGPDVFETDDSGITRILGIFVPLGTIQEWTCKEYLKKKIGFGFSHSQTLTLTEDATQDERFTINDTDDRGQVLRHVEVDSSQLSELMVGAGLCRKHDLEGGRGYPGHVLDNNSNLDTQEAAALSATRLIHNATYGSTYLTQMPPKGSYNSASNYYRRIYVDLTNGTNPQINYMLSQFNTGIDLKTDLTTITAGDASLAVNGENFKIPHPSSPACDFLILLDDSDSTGWQFKIGPDSGTIMRLLERFASADDLHPIGSNNDSNSSSYCYDRIFSSHTLSIGFPSTASNEQALAIQAKFDQDRYENRVPLVHTNKHSVTPRGDLRSSRTWSPIVAAQSLDVIPQKRVPSDWVPHRSAIRELGINKKTYYSGSDCLVFINGEFLDQASAVAHSISVGAKPQFDYHTVHPKFFSRGKVAIRGVLRFPVVAPNLLQEIVNLSKQNPAIEGTDQFVRKSFDAIPATIFQLRENYTKALVNDNTTDLTKAITQLDEFNRAQKHLVDEIRTRTNTGIPFQPGDKQEDVVDNRGLAYLDTKIDSLSIYMGAGDFVNFDNSMREPMFITNYEDVWLTDMTMAFVPESQVVEAQVNFIARLYREYEHGRSQYEEARRESIANESTFVVRPSIQDTLLKTDPRRATGGAPTVPNGTRLSIGSPYDLTHYGRLWSSMTLSDGAATAASAILINNNKARYEDVVKRVEDEFKVLSNDGTLSVATKTIPWYVVGIIHYREFSSFDGTAEFDQTIVHGGDLDDEIATHKNLDNTANDKEWEADVVHHLLERHYDGGYNELHLSWTLGQVLQFMESWNGFGYHSEHTGIYSPYIWGKTNHHTLGKFTSDNVYDSTASEDQSGGAALLKQLITAHSVTTPTLDS